jgi:xylose isomerase
MPSKVGKYPQDQYVPKPEHRFTFGLWTVGNPGRDPFGDPVRPVLAPTRIVEKLAELGAYGVNLHDGDLIPSDASMTERRRIVTEFKKALDQSGMKVPMATTNLFSDAVFKEGAFTANDAKVRQFALQKTMRAMDLGVELGATIYVFWGGREGVETNASKTPQDAIQRFRDCMNFLCEYAIDNLGREISLRFEPRADGCHLNVALASMAAKYLREVCMLQFNRYWAAKVPGLKPTAGYPTDAGRFFADIQPRLAADGTDERAVWRAR